MQIGVSGAGKTGIAYARALARQGIPAGSTEPLPGHNLARFG